MLAPLLLAATLTADLPPLPSQVNDVIESNCVRCHSGEKPKGGLDLKLVLEDGAEAEIDDWKEIVHVLSSGEMPPEDEPGPTAADRAQAISHLQQWSRRLLENRPENPGTVAARRLSRSELRKTLRDLTGIDIDVKRHLPADPSSDGFDNQGASLSLSPMIIERLFRIAEETAISAVMLPQGETAPTRRYEIDQFFVTGQGRVQSDHAYFWSGGSATSQHFFPRAGTYQIAIEAWGQQAGADPVRFGIKVDDQRIGIVDFPETRGSPGRRVIKTKIKQGSQQISASFFNDYYRPEHPDPQQRDRNAALVSIEISGPEEGLEPTDFQKKALQGQGDPVVRLGNGIRRWLPRFWRRPVNDKEVDQLVATAQLAATDPTSAESLLRAALITAIVSPRFILRTEPDPRDASSGTIRNLNGFEIATRLSFFLWGTTPDEELLKSAAEGDLDHLDGIREQTTRLLTDPRSRSLAREFATQWLRIRDLDDRQPDQKIFPGTGKNLLNYMRTETIELFDHVLRNHRPIEELIAAPYTFVNQRLSRHYGIPGVRGEQFQKIEVKEPRGGGLLSQGSVLLTTSTRQRTSPVLRGKWILEVLLDDAPPPPPPGAGTLPLPGEAGADLPLREQLELHRREPTCSICHRRMDALGFSLERFNAVGNYREGKIDDQGELPDGSLIMGVEDLRSIISKSAGFRRSLAKNLFVYALGRGLTDGDARALFRLESRLQVDPTLSDLIDEIVSLEGFRMRKVP